MKTTLYKALYWWCKLIRQNLPAEKALFYIYIYAYGGRFYPNGLTAHSSHMFCEYVCSKGFQSMTFVQLKQSSSKNHPCTKVKKLDCDWIMLIVLRSLCSRLLSHMAKTFVSVIIEKLHS